MIKKAKSYAFLLLRYRPRSAAEFREKLNKHGFSEDVINELTADFKKRGLLDDAKFAKMWIENRTNLKPTGKARLKQELAEKGVSEFDIEDAISAASGLDEAASAKALAIKKAGQLKGLDEVTAKRRLYGYLQRRGFSFDIVSKAVREAIENES